MALSLSAEQKSIQKILTNDKFIIPSYQRPYSWTNDQCQELWGDITTFFESAKRKEGYFLGNLVFAKSEELEELEVIDGQQRLTTLSLFIKALSFFDTENGLLEDCLFFTDRRDKSKRTPRLKTVVFQEKDNSQLIKCLMLESKDEVHYDSKDKFQTNLAFFIEQINSYSENQKISELSDFLLDKVYVLPIQSVDKEQDNAREKALTIFETINNRGLDLNDADIFKAQLFNAALNQGRHEQFIAEWDELENFCNETIPATKKNDNRPLLDIFRIYTHVLRGRENNAKSEIGLRQFFTNLPLKKQNDSQVMTDLNHIIVCVKLIDDILRGKSEIKNTDLRKWLQLLDEYTNNYPKYALYVYLFKNAIFNHDGLVDTEQLDIEPLTALTKELVRCAYYIGGSTTNVKFEIFEAINRISHGEVYSYHADEKKFNEKSLSYFGILKRGMALLCLYLDVQQKPLEFIGYYTNLVTTHDKVLDISWADDEDVSRYENTLGNMCLTASKKTTLLDKLISLENSPFQSLQMVGQKKEFTLKDYTQRQKQLTEKLRNFFLGKI